MGTSPLEAIYFHDFKNSFIPNILEEVYRDKVYAPFLEGQKDLIIVDCGANIGLTSYYFKDFAKTVYSIEPSKQHLECIEAMIKGVPKVVWEKVTYPNPITNIKVCPVAISNHDGTEKFYHSPNTTMFSLKDTVTDKNDYEAVETQTFETFMKNNDIDHIDFLKLDVEGAEDLVITSDGFRNVAPKIKVIMGEYHSWSGMSPPMFANTMTDLGFTFTWLKGTDASVFTAVRE